MARRNSAKNSRRSLFRCIVKTTFCLVAATLYAQTSNGNDSFTLKGTMFQSVADRLNIDPLLLYSIAITESAAGTGNGNIGPYPYVFRSADGPRFFKNKADATIELSKVLRRTRDVDIGMLQINLKHHPQHNPSDLLDPYYNLTAGAKYLKAMMGTTKDPVIGVGRYHSWSEERAQWYGQTVWQTYRNIHQIATSQN